MTENAGPALLFENVAGSSIPVVAGLFGTERRLLYALKAEALDEIADRITALVRPDLPEGMLEALRLLPKFAEVAQWPPQRTTTALAQQVVHMGSDVDLGTLPVPICWPGETLPTLTAAQLLIEEPVEAADSGDAVPLVRRILSRVPVQILDRNTVLINWTSHDESWRLINDAVQ